MISPAYLQLRLSGGATNALPGASLGGAMGLPLVSQSYTSANPITGVTLVSAEGLYTKGAGHQLNFVSATKMLSWKPAGAAGFGPAVDVTAGGVFELVDAAVPTASLFLEVDVALLPAVDALSDGSISTVKNSLFPDVPKQEAMLGSYTYRCFYITNVHPTLPFLNVEAYMQAPVGADYLGMALDPIGVCDGINTVATSIAEQSATPTDPALLTPLTFVEPQSLLDPLTFLPIGVAIGPLAPGECAAIWLQRMVLTGTTQTTPDDFSSVVFSLTY